MRDDANTQNMVMRRWQTATEVNWQSLRLNERRLKANTFVCLFSVSYVRSYVWTTRKCSGIKERICGLRRWAVSCKCTRVRCHTRRAAQVLKFICQRVLFPFFSVYSATVVRGSSALQPRPAIKFDSTVRAFCMYSSRRTKKSVDDDEYVCALTVLRQTILCVRDCDSIKWSCQIIHIFFQQQKKREQKEKINHDHDPWAVETSGDKRSKVW